MDAKELRIGNKLYFPFISKNVEIIGINAYWGKEFGEYPKKLSVVEGINCYCDALSCFKPIPLTEKLLSENCNFILHKGFDDQHYWYLTSDKEKFNRFELLEVDNGFLLPSDEKIEFLHQLQNCYYFHSLKEELIVNL